ncbi:MAG: hypothetical protein GAK32_01883 [Pseudomonas fluorescens]|nr:MAG: hypothetical protein GAK32_01883 [Pseudomonas fluorescens]
MTRVCTSPLLPAPTLPGAHQQDINAHAATCLLVDIAPYPGMEEGDVIELFWNDCFAASRRISAGRIGTPTRLRVPESFVQDGLARIHYHLLQIGYGPVGSPALRVPVKTHSPGGGAPSLSDDENQHLAPVVLPETIARQGLNPHQIRRGIPLSIEPYRNMAAGDEITLRWGDARMDLPPVQPGDIDQPVHVWVPSALIMEAGDDQRLEVTYCILDRVGNNSRWAPARTLRIATLQGAGPG